MPGFPRYGHIYGAVDDLYQKIAFFFKLKLFFSIRSIRLSTVYVKSFAVYICVYAKKMCFH